MSEMNSVVAIYDTHVQAEEAVKELQRSGFDMKKMSIVGKDYHTDEHVVGYYNTGDRMKYQGQGYLADDARNGGCSARAATRATCREQQIALPTLKKWNL